MGGLIIETLKNCIGLNSFLYTSEDFYNDIIERSPSQNSESLFRQLWNPLKVSSSKVNSLMEGNRKVTVTLLS